MVEINSRKNVLRNAKAREQNLYQLENSVNECSEDVIDNAINIGRYYNDLQTKDLERLFNITRQFREECDCRKKT